METLPEKYVGTPCLNCGEDLVGHYCAHCGQRVRDVNLSLRTLFVEFFESLFSLEFGFWQTFKRLVFMPGTLTAEYLAGRRKRYSSPIRLYLGTSLLFFFVIGFAEGDGSAVRVTDDDGTVLTGQEAADVLRGINAGVRSAAPDSLRGAEPRRDWFEDVLADTEESERRFMTYLPRAMFLMVPLSALLFRLVYLRHQRPYLHYLVFSLHLHALFYFTASMAGLMDFLRPEPLGEIAASVVLLTFPVATVRAQRRAFGDPWWKAVLKAAFVWHAYGLLLAVVILGALAVIVVTA